MYDMRQNIDSIYEFACPGRLILINRLAIVIDLHFL